MSSPDLSPKNSKRDIVLLDLLNLFIAPIGGGAGAYVAYYFASGQHWDAGQIGSLLSVITLCLALAQIPAGLIIDRSAKRNYITAIASVVIALCWFGMLIFPARPVVLIAGAIIGVACAFFAPALASISLGLVGYEGLDIRLGRNGIFSHAGNVLAAISIGLCTGYLSGQSVLGLLIIVALFAALAAVSISKRSYSSVKAHPADLSTDCATRYHPLLKGLFGLLNTPGSRVFAITALLYTVANASMLPLMVQVISKQGAHAVSLQLPSALLLTELVMIPVCFLASRQARFGRRPLLILSFSLLVLRGIGFTFIKIPALLVAMQILDGISAGIFGLVITLVVADFCQKTGRFNATLSALFMLLTIANSLSEFCSGMLASHFGFSVTFGILTLIGTLGLMTVITLLPETGRLYGASSANDEKAVPVPASN